jgi:predicted transcriptional regulator with HTH domain
MRFGKSRKGMTTLLYALILGCLAVSSFAVFVCYNSFSSKNFQKEIQAVQNVSISENPHALVGLHLNNVCNGKILKIQDYIVDVYQDKQGNNYFIISNSGSKIKQVFGPIPQNEFPGVEHK